MRPYHRHLLGGGGADAVADAGLLVLRVFAGLALAFAHGLGKLPPSERFVGTVAGMGFPAPELFAWLAGLAEFGGGLFLAAGLLARPAAVIIALNMGVAAFIRHAADPFAGKELALMFFFLAVLFALTGPGRFSADAVLFGRHANRSAGRYTRV
jgi:putative oxidoreductase